MIAAIPVFSSFLLGQFPEGNSTKQGWPASKVNERKITLNGELGTCELLHALQ